MSYSVKHNSEFRKFYINVNGREAFLRYEKTGEGVLEFRTLFVPKNLRGVGIAEKVLKRAIGYAEKNNFKVKTNCAYINGFLEGHPEYREILSNRPDMHSWILHYN